MISPIYFFTKSGCAWSAKMLPIIEKINVLKDMVEAVDGNRVNTRYSAYSFVQSLLDQAQSRLSLSEKQMSALIKCYKKYNLKFETLFKENKYLKFGKVAKANSENFLWDKIIEKYKRIL